MIKRHEFIERTLYLIRKKLNEKLPKESSLNEMIDKTKQIIKEIYK
jgi:hypothetical protein